MQQKIDSIFTERWSSYAYDGSKLSDGEKQQLLAAASTAPSCYNDQPWTFIVSGDDEADRQKFLSLLAPPNQKWAVNAGMLCFVAAKRYLDINGELNRHHGFDCGTAWGYMALQAQKMGLSAHAMAGFDVEKSYEVLGVDKEKWEVMTAIVVGHPTEDALKNQKRTTRKPISEISRSL